MPYETNTFKYATVQPFGEPTPLDPRKELELSDFLAGLGLSQHEQDEILEIARYLRGFQMNGLAKYPTPTDRIQSMRRVAALAGELQGILQNQLSRHDLSVLDHAMTIEDLPYPKMMIYRLDGRTGYVATELSQIERAAALTAESWAAEQGLAKPGRRPVVAAFQRFVEAIHDALDEDDAFSIGRGGAFERLCDAVFEAAQVSGKPAAAIRRAAKHAAVINSHEYRQELAELGAAEYRSETEAERAETRAFLKLRQCYEDLGLPVQMERLTSKRTG